MKREKQEEYKHGLFRARTFLCWRTCCVCEQEFRREQGWHFVSGPFKVGHNRMAGKRSYLCSDCAPTREDATKIAKTLMQRNRGKRPSGSEIRKIDTNTKSGTILDVDDIAELVIERIKRKNMHVTGRHGIAGAA